jgi:hypothetical protein
VARIVATLRGTEKSEFIATCKELPVIPVNKVVHKKRIIGKKEGHGGGFDSHQGIRFLGKHSSAAVYKMT